MLYDPRRFEPLTDEVWQEDRIRAAIAEIVLDADEAFDADGLWPADEWDAWQTPTPLKALYVGAAGVVWALDALRRRGYREPLIDLARAARRTLEVWREEPDLMRAIELPEPARAGLLSGQSGILAVAYRLDPDDVLADELRERVLENVDNDAVEIMWARRGRCSPPAGCSTRRARRAGRMPGARAPHGCSNAVTRTASGRSDSTEARREVSGRRTESWATCSPCSEAAISWTTRRRLGWSEPPPPCSGGQRSSRKVS